MARTEDMSNEALSSLEIQLTTAVLILVSLLLTLAFLLTGNGRGQHPPPGPRGVPLLGYLPFFGKEAHLTFNSLRETYGDVCSLRFGSWPAVALSGLEVVKEALITKGDDFSGRPPFTMFLMMNRGRSFAFGVFDDVWKKKRAAVMTAMRKFLAGKTDLMEDVVHAEVNVLVADLERKHHEEGESVDPKEGLSTFVSCLFYQLSYGKLDNAKEDQGFKDELSGLSNFSQARLNILLDAMPWIRHLQHRQVARFRDVMADIEGRGAVKIAKHEASFKASGLRDLADYLIQAGNELPEEDEALGLSKQLVVESLDFLKHGHGSVGSALEWLVLLMARHPEVQDKAFKELNDVVGLARRPILADRENLPFVEATILEVIRFACPLPLAVAHYTTRDTQLQGFDVPKNTVVLVNLHSLHQDEALWGNPQHFRPERFLSEAGRELNETLVDQLSAFSLGRRRCPGESLARAQLFLIFTNLLQRVRFSKPPAQPEEYSMEGYYEPSRKPKPYGVCVTPRASE